MQNPKLVNQGNIRLPPIIHKDQKFYNHLLCPTCSYKLDYYHSNTCPNCSQKLDYQPIYDYLKHHGDPEYDY